MVFFRKPYTLRHFGEAETVRGRERYKFEESIVHADIQTSTRNNTMDTEGATLTSRIQVWTDEQITPTDQECGQLGDWIYYSGRWFQCISSLFAGNTLISHWVSEFDFVPLTDPQAKLLPAVVPGKNEVIKNETV